MAFDGGKILIDQHFPRKMANFMKKLEKFDKNQIFKSEKVPVVQARRNSSYRRILSIFLFLSEKCIFFSHQPNFSLSPRSLFKKGPIKSAQRGKGKNLLKKSIFEKSAHTV